MASDWFGGSVSILNDPASTASLRTPLSMNPSTIFAGSQTAITVQGTLASSGNRVVFLFAGGTGCANAFGLLSSQGGLVREGEISITLSTAAVYKVCVSAQPNPTSDADFILVAGVTLEVLPPEAQRLLLEVQDVFFVCSAAFLAGGLGFALANKHYHLLRKFTGEKRTTWRWRRRRGC